MQRRPNAEVIPARALGAAASGPPPSVRGGLCARLLGGLPGGRRPDDPDVPARRRAIRTRTSVIFCPVPTRRLRPFPIAVAGLGFALARPPAALALETDSLRSAGSFALFRDAFDLLREPASLSELEGRHVYTLLGNQGGGGRATLGYAGVAGPGFLGVFGDFQVSSAAATSQVVTVEEPGGIDDTTTSASASRSLGFGLFAGYGVRPEDWPIALGFGLGYEGSAWTTSLARGEAGQPPVIGGDHEGHYSSGLADLEESGEYRDEDHHVRGVVGVAFEAGALELEGDVHVAWTRSTATAVVDQVSGGEVYHLEGYYPGTPFTDDQQGVIPGGAIDAHVRLARVTTLRAFAAFDGGDLSPHQDRLVERTEGSDGVVTEAIEERVDVEMAGWAAAGLLALHLDFAPVALRLGVGAELVGFDAEGLRVSDTTVDGILTESSTLRETHEERLYALSTPVAAEVALTPLWTLRTGARYRVERYRAAGTTSAQEATATGVVADAYETSQVRSQVDFALGLRFQPVRRFSLDALVKGTAVGEDRLSVSLGALFLSAVIHP